MSPRKAYGLRLDEADAELFDEICAIKHIGPQRALEEAAKEYMRREQRYLKGKEECRNALMEYIDKGEVIDEPEMDRFVADKLKAKGVTL